MGIIERAIVIGDIHGCRNELAALVDACGVRPGDTVISVGDLVAKGPDSAGVLAFAREHRLLAVLGNHDAHVLDLHEAGHHEAARRGRIHHFEVAESLTDADLAYLRSSPLWLRLPGLGPSGQDVVVVHGGFVPGVAPTEQTREHCLNLRSIRGDGTPSRRIEGYPWASLWRGPEFLVFGHDAVRGLQRHPHATGLDTGCVYGKHLTALILPEHRLVAVPADHAYDPID